MAIAFVSASDLGNANGASPFSASYTSGAGSDRLLIVVFDGDVATGADDITGVTYAGVAMTLAAKKVGQINQNRNLYFYYLLNPASGSNTVVISYSGSHYILAGAANYTGIGSLDATNTNFGFAATTLATSLTTVADNSWMMLASDGTDGAHPAIAGAGSTRRAFDGTFGVWAFFDHNAAISPAASTSMTVDYQGNAFAAQIAVSFAPVGAAGGGNWGPLLGQQLNRIVQV